MSTQMAPLRSALLLKTPLTNILRCGKFSSSSLSHGFSGYKIKNKLHSRQAAQDFLFRLNQRERTVLLEELQQIQAQANTIQDVEKVTPPTSAQLRAIAAHSAMPFIGFGFLDNCIMIVAGDYIDTTIGVTLGISTMAAAGLGNALSDVAGIGSAYYVETVASKVGVEAPSLTPGQSRLARTRWCINLGRAFGVVVGCILGMFPLLFLSPKESTSTEKKAEQSS